MKNTFNFIFLILFVCSCTIRPGIYSTDYSYLTTPPINVVTPTPIYNPYLYNPYLYRPNVYVNPYPRNYRWSYNPPRPRTTTVIVNTNGGNHHHHSGPRGGRRK